MKRSLEGRRWSPSLVAGIVAAGLAAPSFAQETPREADKVWPYLAGLAKDQRVAVMEREARKEGGLTLYGATGLDRANFWIGEFNKRYPDIKVEFVRLTATDLYEKVASERRLKRSQSDLVITTITYLDLLAGDGAFAPYETVHWDDFDPKFRFGGAGKGWTAVVYELFPHAIAWRTDRVAKEAAPKSLEQLADPRWQGRVGTTTHLEDFLHGLFTLIGDEKGKALAQRLAQLKNRLYRSHAALADGLAAGEVDVAWELVAARPIDLQKKGAPVDWVPMDPLFAEGNTISVNRDTKKPYAAALFVDAMLSPAILESSDRWQGGRVFGNRKGKFSLSLDNYPKLFIFPALSKDRYAELNRLAEQMFVR